MGKRLSRLEKGTGSWRTGPGLGTAFLFSALAFDGCRSAPVLTPQQAEGQHLYAVRCAHCHDENDLELKPPPPDLHGAMSRAKLPGGAVATDAEVRRVVLAGKGKMPNFAGRFTDEQTAALLVFLRTEMHRSAEALDERR
jgi:mono/diheme cytochrome c family protein